MIIQVENRTLILLNQVTNEVNRITDALKSAAKYGKTSIDIKLVTGTIPYRAPDGYKFEDVLLDLEESELVRSFVVKALQDYNFVVESNNNIATVSLKLNKKKENNNG
jgi:hypothetical protein